MASFLSRIWTSHQVRPENLKACPAEAFNLVCPAFHRTDFFGSEFWDTQPWTFFPFGIAIAPWVLSLFDLLLGFSSRSTCRYKPLLPWMHQVSRLVVTTHGRNADHHDAPIEKEFKLQSQVWPLDFSSVCRQSVLFPSVQKRMFALYLFASARHPVFFVPSAS